MATLNSIEAALELIDSKKANLKKAFDDLQAHSSVLSSFSLSWSDLDSHFTSVQTSLTHRFHLLQSLEQSRPNPPNQSFPTQPQSNPLTQPTEPSSSNPPGQNGIDSVDDAVVPRPELKALCEKMDGKGLRNYVIDHVNERNEILGALRCAPDPGSLVLDAMDGFFGNNPNSKGDRDPRLHSVRTICIALLEQLMGIGQNFDGEVRERAKKLGAEWKGKVSMTGENPLVALGFLHLIATYGLVSEFNLDELVDYFVIVARFRQATDLCKIIGMGEKTSDVIQNLISKGKQLLAVRFIFEFKLTDKFPPVPLLRAYVNASKRVAKKVCNDGKNSLKSMNEVREKELNALKQVIKAIEKYELDSEYPMENLKKRIEQLEKQKADRKHSAAAPAPKRQLQTPKQHHQQSGSKRPRTTPVNHAAVPRTLAGANSTVPLFQQSHAQPAGLLPERPGSKLSLQPGPYGLVGSTSTIDPYAGSSAGMYGSAGAPMGFPGNPGPANSQFYSPESHLPSRYHNRPTAYGGYDLLPQYHLSYYPQ